MATGATAVQAEKNNHYRWLNEQGEAVYSDRPPPAGIDYEIVSSTSGFSRAVHASEGGPRDAAEDGIESARKQVTVSEEARREQLAEFCAKARANLEALQGDAQIVVRTPDGEQRTLSPREVEQQRETARAQVDSYCQ